MLGHLDRCHTLEGGATLHPAADEPLLARIASRADEMIRFASQLVATPSPNPPGDARAVAEVIVREARILGLPAPEVLAEVPEHPNLVFKLRGRQPGPTLVITGHTDTKPVGADARWSTDPLKPTIQDGKLYGLGSTDMKGAVAAMLYALAALQPDADALRGELVVVLTADEEAGSRFGAHYLAERRLIQADAALVGEPCGITRDWESVDVVGRGITCFRVAVRGTQMHSSCSDVLPSVNASVKLAEVLDRLGDTLRLDYRPHRLCPQGITINAGVSLSGGVGFGVYPGYAEFATDIRTLPGMTEEGVARDLGTFLDGLRAEDPELRVEWEFADPPLRWIEATEVSPEEPFVRSALWAAEQVLGTRPPLGTFPGATDATPFQHLAGIRCIPSVGPGLLPLAHGPNEYVPVESVVQAAKIYALAVADYLG